MADEASKSTARASATPSAPAEPLLVLIDRSIDPRVAVVHEPQSVVAEQFRTFRTNLVAVNAGGQPRALALTSAIKGEGKSITVANLGAALSELPGCRVLLVDADRRSHRWLSRRPFLHCRSTSPCPQWPC